MHRTYAESLALTLCFWQHAAMRRFISPSSMTASVFRSVLDSVSLVQSSARPNIYWLSSRTVVSNSSRAWPRSSITIPSRWCTVYSSAPCVMACKINHT